MSQRPIETDRQSNVSSFYGRRGSFEAPPTGGAVPRSPRDDASSFYGNNRLSRTSNELLSAGYNQSSFANPGRIMPVRAGRDEEMGFVQPSVQSGRASSTIGRNSEVDDPGWDVYNDFNNKGPRYSEAYGASLATAAKSESGYAPIATPSSVKAKSEYDSAADPSNNVELVTVPALGAEWKRSELAAMRKGTKRAEKNEERMRKFKTWWRDQAGCFGGILTRKALAIGLFVFCCVLAIILGITLPRVPDFSFDGTRPLSPAPNDTSSNNGDELPWTGFSRAPANFSFPGLLNIQVDTHANVIPLQIKSIYAELYDLNTNRFVGNGSYGSTKLSARYQHPIAIPVRFTYASVNDSDITWLNFYNACRSKSQYANGVRPGFNLQLILTTRIAGMIKKVTASTQINSVECPIELPSNSV